MAKRKNKTHNRRFSDSRRQKMIEATKQFELAGEVGFESLEAAADGEAQKLPTFEMMAYNGGKFNPRGYYIPVIVELASASVYTPAASPVYRDHDPSQVVGHGKIIIDKQKQQIRIDNGVVSASNSHAKEVVESARNGFPWRCSIGASGGSRQYFGTGEKVTVNGQTFSGPVVVAKGVVVGEISFVSLGGEKYATANIAASHSSEDEMDEEFKIWAASQGFNDVENMAENAVAFLQAQYEQEQNDGSGKGQVTPPGPKNVVASTAHTGTDLQANVDKFNQGIAEAAERARQISDIAAQCEVTTIEVDGKKVGFVAHAIKAGWSVEQVRDKAKLEQLLAGRSTASIHSHSGEPLEAELLTAGLCQSLSIPEKTIGLPDNVMQAAHTRWGGRLSLKEVLLEAAADAGQSFRRYEGNERTVLQAAFSTVSLPIAMSNTANKSALMAFDAVMSEWRPLTDITQANDFKTMTRHRLTSELKFEKVGAAGEIKHGTLGEESFTNQVETYAKMLALTRQDIRNDDLGQLLKVPRLLGRGGGLAFNDIYWAAFQAAPFAAATKSKIEGSPEVTPWYLVGDPAGLPLIEAAFLDGKQVPYIESMEADFNTLGVQMRGYYDFGVSVQDIRGGLKVTKALTYDNLSAALTYWDTKVDADGEPLMNDPMFLVVPSSYYLTALELMNSTEVRSGDTGKTMTKNILQGRLTVVKSKYLANS